MLHVWKFGGASVADASAIRRVAALVAGHDGPLVVVVSALAGVTDSLLGGARKSASGDASAGVATAAAFVKRHRPVLRELVRDRRRCRELLAILDKAAREYADLTRALAALGSLPPLASDRLVSRGERLAGRLVAAALAREGRRAAYVDAAGFLMTDGHHGDAMPDLDATRVRARRALLPLVRRGVTPVVPGFVGSAPDGSLVTLGRGGSDLTATLLGRALGAARVVLWKDVPGVLSADPRAVPDARLIPQLHHREAAEVAYYGAKVLHPRALIPIAQSRVVLEVRSFLDPARPGTEVSARRTDPDLPVKALATIGGQAIVTVAGKGMLGVPGIAARTFGAVQQERLSVSTIFQASSESSIGFTLEAAQAPRAVHALRRAFKEELAAGLVDSVTARDGLSVIAVVGEGMAGTPGIAARLFTALAEGGVNVVAVAQGSSERNISFVVDSKDVGEAQRRVHAAFQLSKVGGGRRPEAPRRDVVLLGFGRVGRELADQIAAVRGDGLRIVGLLDRSGFVFSPRGIPRSRQARLAAGKDAGRLLAELGARRADARVALGEIAGHAVSRPVLVDVTAEETGDLLLAAVGQGFDLVLANKKPLAGSAGAYARLFRAAREAGRRVLYEATVGAGLPILDTLRKLVDSGDRVYRVEGCVSGTLGVVLSAVTAGRPFSEAVREAVARGYSEPDPREDLSGRDAARKGLILARLLGYPGPPPAPVDLVPAAFRGLPLPRFMERLPELDPEWRRRVARAAARGRVLRYVVTATRSAVRAELLAVASSSPIGSLSGTRNLVSFTSRRYRAEPLVITGPGAGAEVTAAGLLNDLQQLARS
ncbi:MAG TPA: aspartate kinase [Vicinamibacteria bacterium]|nr:aspartate kinase [Vicinamibacteria bacterium]